MFKIHVLNSILAGIAALSFAQHHTLAQGTTQTIFLNDDQAPDTPSGAVFEGFFNPVLNKFDFIRRTNATWWFVVA